MIKITVDEGYAFDMLAIACVKSNINEKLRVNFNNLWDELLEQVGRDMMLNVTSSEEYALMCRVNLEIFTMVDESKTDGGLAKKLDEKNYERYLIKTKMQEKFFGSKAIEQKIGYNGLN